MNIYCLVMAGGSGTRFWPESTSKKPKQYLQFFEKNSLLRESLLRFENIIKKENRYIVTVKNQELLARESGEGEIATNGIIFEPAGRNTAPCILLSLASLEMSGAKESDVVVIVPADHVILNKEGFRKSITRAAETALSKNKIVTIGVRPTFPHTGYGYILKGEEIGPDLFKVDIFKEKPTFDLAAEYVASGEYFWNAGMFVAPIKVLKDEFLCCAPEMFCWYQELLSNLKDPARLAKTYESIPANSIDYAVMEKSKNVLVLPAEFDWNDLGSWDALEDVIKKRDDNVVASSNGQYFKNAKGNIVFTPNKMAVLVNVDDLIVVSNENVVMVLPKKDSQEVKNIVSTLKNSREHSSLI